jgi:hypothetical protein
LDQFPVAADQQQNGLDIAGNDMGETTDRDQIGHNRHDMELRPFRVLARPLRRSESPRYAFEDHFEGRVDLEHGITQLRRQHRSEVA